MTERAAALAHPSERAYDLLPRTDRQMAAKASSRGIGAALALVFVFAPVCVLAQSKGRIVQCRVVSDSKVSFDGKCRFTPDGSGGSFTLENRNSNRPFFGSILIVSVSIIEPGRAEVRGLTSEGVNSRWGPARRSTQDPACWVGSDFRICAR
jgi:hypothetical protein